MKTYTVNATKDDGSACSLSDLSVMFEQRVRKLNVKDKLETLEATLTGPHKQLVLYLKANLAAIIRAKPTELTQYISHITATFPLPESPATKTFNTQLYDSFSYDNFRQSTHATWLATRLNVKTCLYCNTAYTVVVDKLSGATKKRKALLEFDHYHSKDIYPYLSLSFFNLIPACGNCNRLLSNTTKTVHPYLTSLDDLFTVSLTDASVAMCRLHPNREPVVDVILNNTEFEPVFDCLAIKSRYAHFADIGQEIVWRQSIYTTDYLNDLRARLSLASFTRDQANRFILGNYCDPSEYHKRPLAKFYTDVGKQLKLLD